MDFTKPILANRQMLVSDLLHRTEAALAPFHVALNCFLATLFKSKLPANWREEWHRFVDWQLGEGIRVDPQSVRELEDWMEDWARFCRLLPTIEKSSGSASAASRFEVGPPGNREEFFDQQLALAERHLDEIASVLSALGATLDAATPGEIVDVDAEVIAIEESIWQYNAALANARAAWLRADLSTDANRRLLALRTPHRWGLPEFTDELQAQHALQQEALVNERLRRRNISVERVDVGKAVADVAETSAGIALGGGATMTVTRKNARWTAVKKPSEHNTQTIHGIDLAAAVIAYILRHRPGRRDPVATFPSLASQMRRPAKPASTAAVTALKSQPNPPLSRSPAKPQRPPSRPANWPKLTPEEIKRSEREYGQGWWTLQPIGETDWVWLTALERQARTARDSLVVFYHEVATLGGMAKALGDPEAADIEPLFAQRERVQRAYDIYIKTLIEAEGIWTKYLKETRVFVGIHVIALKKKIDRALPTSVEGFHSTLDGQLKVETRQSSEALRIAQGRVEGVYTTLLWTDRVITVIQYANAIRGILAGVKVAFEAGIAKGLAPAVARRAAIAVSISHLAIAAGSAAAIDYAVPKILVGAGFNEADVHAGMAVFAALLTFAEAVKSASAKPRTKAGLANDKDSNYQSPPSPAPGRGVWDLGPVTRGEIIHERLGQNLPRSFETIDIFDNGIVKSIKSIDLQAKTYQKADAITRLGQKYVELVADFKEASREGVIIKEAQIKGRGLLIAVPPGATPEQKRALDALKPYGHTKHVNVEIVEIDR